jgi:hypothetical protein
VMPKDTAGCYAGRNMKPILVHGARAPQRNSQRLDTISRIPSHLDTSRGNRVSI